MPRNPSAAYFPSKESKPLGGCGLSGAGVSPTTSFAPLAARFRSQENVRRDLLLGPRLVQAADESSLSRGSFALASLSVSCMPVGIDAVGLAPLRFGEGTAQWTRLPRI